MLVPAMAFAWWLVSLSIPLPGAKAATAADVAAPPAEVAVAPPTVEGAADVQAVGDEPSVQSETPPIGEEPIADDDAEAVGERVALKVVTPQIVRMAKTFLDLPMGTERYVAIDGNRYVFVLERHYHPPGFVGGPHGWHKGVTAYELQ